MKVAVKEAPKAFEPITLTITIETREELLDMYARHLMTNGDVTMVIREDDGDWVVKDKPLLYDAVNSLPDDADDVPLLVKLHPFVKTLSL